MQQEVALEDLEEGRGLWLLRLGTDARVFAAFRHVARRLRVISIPLVIVQ